MIVEELTTKDESSWDNFVAQKIDGTFYHQIAWKKLIEKVYGNRFKPIYLIARDQKEIRGLLPLFLSNHWLIGKKLISTPFAINGGSCTDSEVVEDMLIKKAIELCKDLDAEYLELRNTNPKNGDLSTNKNYFTLVLDMNSSLENLRKNFRNDVKRQINKAIKNEIKVEMFSNDIEKFYHIYSMGQRNLGTPVQNFAWISSLFKDFMDNHVIAIAYYQQKAIGVQFLRKFKDTVCSVFGYTPLEYRSLCPNHLLIWELIQYYHQQGYTKFDFGRSLPESGTFSFKKAWGAQPKQLHYQYYLNNSKMTFDTCQKNPKRQRFAKMWKMMPLPMANIIGPIIRGYFP